MVAFTPATEDWSGLKDAKARRKLQNRLNQRARRQRQVGGSPGTTPKDAAPKRWIKLKEPTPPVAPVTPHTSPSARLLQSLEYTIIQSSPVSPGSAPLVHISRDIPHFQDIRRSPDSSSFYFPLSVDHLLTLIYYNVFRALNINTSILQLEEYVIDCNASEDDLLISPRYSSQRIPAQLQPTALQLSQPHSIWLDIFPHAGIRDNAIRHEGLYDADEFCFDLVGHCYDHGEEFQGTQRAAGPEAGGLLVWGDPWDWQSWEVTPGFIRKWGWMLRGCHDMILQSNRWRELRGEEPLCVEV